MGEELEQLRSREVGEEIQLAETKLAMHKEMLEKDEQVSYGGDAPDIRPVSLLFFIRYPFRPSGYQIRKPYRYTVTIQWAKSNVSDPDSGVFWIPNPDPGL